MIFRVAYTFLCYCAVLEGVPQRGVGHHRQHRSWSVRGGPGEHWVTEVRLGDSDHEDSDDNRDNGDVDGDHEDGDDNGDNGDGDSDHEDSDDNRDNNRDGAGGTLSLQVGSKAEGDVGQVQHLRRKRRRWLGKFKKNIAKGTTDPRVEFWLPK